MPLLRWPGCGGLDVVMPFLRWPGGSGLDVVMSLLRWPGCSGLASSARPLSALFRFATNAFGGSQKPPRPGGFRHLPAALVVRASRPRNHEGRGRASLLLRRAWPLPLVISSECRVLVAGAGPSQARTTHAAFGSLSGSRRRARRAACQQGASGRDDHVTVRNTVAGLGFRSASAATTTMPTRLWWWCFIGEPCDDDEPTAGRGRRSR